MKRTNTRRIGKASQPQDLQCPKCSKVLDGVVPVEKTPVLTPRPGDYTICIYCKTILEFTKTLGLKTAIDETLIKAAGTPGLKAAVEAVHLMHQKSE